MKNPAAFWDNLSEKYAKTPIANEDAYRLTLEKTRSYLTPTDHILEVGCGTGATALLIADAAEHITATDFSAGMIEIGKRNAHQQNITNVSFQQAAVADAEMPDKAYDAVLAHNILHLLEDVPAGIDAIAKRVKPGGFFISKTVTEFGRGAPLKWRLMKHVLPLMQWLGKAPHVSFMSVEALEKLITSAGFEIVESGNYPKAHISRYIVAKKL